MQQFVGTHALPQCRYERPGDLQQVLELIGAEGDNCKVIAGCTDFIPAVRKGVWHFDSGVRLVDVRAVDGLRAVEFRDGELVIGAAVRLSELASLEAVRTHARILAEAAQEMGSLQIRNSGTIGGNLCTASPAGDTSPPLLALGARVRIQGRDTDRMLPLEEFFTGPGKTVLEPGQLLTEIHIPREAMESGVSDRCKLGVRKAFTISVIAEAMWLVLREGTVEQARIGLGAVAPTPMRAKKAEDFLVGRPLTETTARECADIVSGEVAPISDLRASESYRREMASVLTRRLLLGCGAQ